MIDQLLLFIFGATFLAAIAMFLNISRVAQEEWREAGNTRTFRISLWWMFGSLGLAGNCAVRVLDGLDHQNFSGSAPVALASFVALLWIAWTGFHWEASERRPLYWRVYVAVVLLWAIVVAWPILRV